MSTEIEVNNCIILDSEWGPEKYLDQTYKTCKMGPFVDLSSGTFSGCLGMGPRAHWIVNFNCIKLKIGTF